MSVKSEVWTDLCGVADLWQSHMHWLDSNFFPRNSTKFEYSNFDCTIRIYIENDPETRKHEVPWLSNSSKFFNLNFWNFDGFLDHFRCRFWWCSLNSNIQTCRILRNKVWIQPLSVYIYFIYIFLHLLSVCARPLVGNKLFKKKL